MDIKAMDKTGISISMPMSDAAWLLQGLEEQRADLGPIADELIALLREKGVKPPQAHPFRMEYMGPEVH